MVIVKRYLSEHVDMRYINWQVTIIIITRVAK